MSRADITTAIARFRVFWKYGFGGPASVIPTRDLRAHGGATLPKQQPAVRRVVIDPPDGEYHDIEGFAARAAERRAKLDREIKRRQWRREFGRSMNRSMGPQYSGMPVWAAYVLIVIVVLLVVL